MKTVTVFPGTTHSGLVCHIILEPGSGFGQTAHISLLSCKPVLLGCVHLCTKVHYWYHYVIRHEPGSFRLHQTRAVLNFVRASSDNRPHPQCKSQTAPPFHKLLFPTASVSAMVEGRNTAMTPPYIANIFLPKKWCSKAHHHFRKGSHLGMLKGFQHLTITR